jgi:hypothetical protein
MSSAGEYKCYSCGIICDYDQLGYECMCIHDESPRNRGVCKPCVPNPISNWTNAPHDIQNHHLTKIHEYSSDVNEWWKNVNKLAPNWNACGTAEDNKDELEFVYHEYNGLSGDELNNYISANNDTNNTLYDDYMSGKFRKRVRVPKIAYKCVCCP